MELYACEERWGRVIESFVQVAQQIVKAVTEVSPFPISLSDEKGYIIGDSDPDRIGSFHPASKLVIEENKPCIFTNEIIAELENVLPGIATPLMFDSKTVGVLGIVGNPEEVNPYAELIKKYVEMRWQENYMAQIVELEHKKLESFLQYLILNPDPDGEIILKYCDHLKIKPYIPRFCIVIDIGKSLMEKVIEAGQPLSVKHGLVSLVDIVCKVFEGDSNTICGFLNSGRILLLQPSYSQQDFQYKMEQFPGHCKTLEELFYQKGIIDVSIASGSAVELVERSHIAYREAEQLLEMGRDLGIHPAIYNYYDWKILLELVPFRLDKDLRVKLMLRLQPFFKDQQFDELANNFIKYCNNNLNLSKTAAALYIHRNTLIYRLKKVEKLTSLDISCFEQCMLLYLVLKSQAHDK